MYFEQPRWFALLFPMFPDTTTGRHPDIGDRNRYKIIIAGSVVGMVTVIFIVLALFYNTLMFTNESYRKTHSVLR